MTKKTPPKPDQTTPESLQERFDRLVIKSIDRAEREDDPDKYVTASRAAAMMIAESRKLKKGDADDITIERVMDWARSLTSADRIRLVRELEHLDSKRSVLA